MGGALIFFFCLVWEIKEKSTAVVYTTSFQGRLLETGC